MIKDMPRPRPPYLLREVTRHGKVVWFVRFGKGPRIRLKSPYGSQEFMDEYDGALEQLERIGGPRKPGSDTLAWLVARYRETQAWTRLSLATRRQRENIFTHVLKAAGHEPYARITRKIIQAGKERRKGNAARHFVQTMRGLFKWAVDSDMIETDPTQGIKAQRPKTDGFAPWPEEWCEAYEKRWPLGTKERVWYEVLYGTGLRRGDAVKVGRQHVRGRKGMIRAEKNKETAYFLVSDRLQQALDAGPVGQMNWIVGESGQPLKKETFGNYFREACVAAKVPGSAHGLRKTRATIEAEKGASEAKLNAMFGWKTGSNTSSIYTRKANREKLAFGEESGTSIPAPLSSSPRTLKNSK